MEEFQDYQHSTELAGKLGAIALERMKDCGLDMNKLPALLTIRGLNVDYTAVRRFFSGSHKQNGHTIQAIARILEELKIIQVPEDYESSGITDYVLDLQSGRVPLDTLKIGKLADVSKQKKAVNKGRRHGSDRPSKTVQPIASIPEETISKSGASAVGTKEGLAILKEAIGDQSLHDFSAKSGVLLSTLEAIMAGKAIPVERDLARIGKALPHLDIKVLLEAYYL